MDVLFMLLLSFLLNILSVFDWLAATFGQWAPHIASLLFIAIPVTVLLRSGGQEDLIITEEVQ